MSIHMKVLNDLFCLVCCVHGVMLCVHTSPDTSPILNTLLTPLIALGAWSLSVQNKHILA